MISNWCEFGSDLILNSKYIDLKNPCFPLSVWITTTTRRTNTRPISIELDSKSTSYQYYYDSVNYSEYGEKSGQEHGESHEVSRSSEEPDTVYLDSYEK